MPASWSDQQRQQAVSDARSRGISQGHIDSFLGENSDDYQRLSGLQVGAAAGETGHGSDSGGMDTLQAPPGPGPSGQSPAMAALASSGGAAMPGAAGPSGGASDTPALAGALGGLTNAVAGQTDPTAAAAGAPMNGVLRAALGTRTFPQQSSSLAALQRIY